MTGSDDTDTASKAEGEQENDEDKERSTLQPECRLKNVTSRYHGLNDTEARKVEFPAEECRSIEEATRDQSASHQWLEQSEGGVAASVLYRFTSCLSGIEGVL